MMSNSFKSLRLALFVLFSTLDVHVQAENLNLIFQDDVTEQPKACLTSSEVCSLKTKSGYRYELKVGSSTLLMGSNTILIRNDLDSVTLVQGEVWVKTESPFKVQSEYGQFQIHKGQACLFREKNKMVARTLTGEGTLWPRGDSEVTLPAGYENWISPADKTGRSGIGLPASIDFKDHILRWTRISGKPLNEVKEELAEQKHTWIKTVQEVSDLHREIVDRELAISGQRESRRQRLEKLRADENEHLHKMYRQKNGL